MFKKFFRKVRDVAKKAAPIAGIAALAGFGLPMLAGSGSAAGPGILSKLGTFGKGLLGNFAAPAMQAAGANVPAVQGSGLLGGAQGAYNLAKGIGSKFINPDGVLFRKVIKTTIDV